VNKIKERLLYWRAKKLIKKMEDRRALLLRVADELRRQADLISRGVIH